MRSQAQEHGAREDISCLKEAVAVAEEAARGVVRIITVSENGTNK